MNTLSKITLVGFLVVVFVYGFSSYIATRNAIVHCFNDSTAKKMQELDQYIKYYESDDCYGVQYWSDDIQWAKSKGREDTIFARFKSENELKTKELTITVGLQSLSKHLKHLINVYENDFQYKKITTETGFRVMDSAAYGRQIIDYNSEDNPTIWKRCLILDDKNTLGKKCQIWVQLPGVLEAKFSISNDDERSLDVLHAQTLRLFNSFLVANVTGR